MDSDSVGRAFTSGELRRGPAILVRHGTSLPPVIRPDRLYLATACRPVSRYPRAQRSRCRVHSRHSDAPARSVKSLLGVFQSLPGEPLPGLVILFLMGSRGTTMSVGGIVVQFCGTLMIFVMRSVAIACRH